MNPVLEGMITYDKLLVPGIRLVDIARMNDALAVRSMNRYLLEKHRAAQNGS